jgi:[ribosomal protein S18]-alanine N-acetyltransferase
MTALHAGCELRSMTDADLPSVLSIEGVAQPTPWSLEIFRDCFKSHYDCRVIVRDNNIVGFVVLSSVLDEVHLLNIAVIPAMQRRGLAWAVLREVIPEYCARGMRYMYLEVRESNHGARALYEHIGFNAAGLRRNYYLTRDGREDAVLMMLDLSAM